MHNGFFNHFLACLEDYSNGLRWPTTRRNTVRALKCSELHPSLRPGVNIERFCKHDGNWDTIDFSACTALPDAISIVIVSFKVNVSESAAEVVAENVSKYPLKILKEVLWNSFLNVCCHIMLCFD